MRTVRPWCHVSNILSSRKTREMLSRGVASIRSPRVPPKGMRKSLTSLIIGSLVSGPHSEFMNLCSDDSLTVDNWRMTFQQILFPGTENALHYVVWQSES